MSNLLHRVRISNEPFEIGTKNDQPEERYVPESRYDALRDKSRLQIKDAYGRGYADGMKAGLAAGQEECRRVSREFHGLIADVQRQRADIYRKAELEIMELAHSIAARIITAYAEAEPQAVIESVRKAVKLLLDKSSLVVRVSPQQELFVRENLDKLHEIDDKIERIEIESDRRVSPGGCVLETESGNVDARIETELENIANALRKTNKGARGN